MGGLPPGEDTPPMGGKPTGGVEPGEDGVEPGDGGVEPGDGGVRPPAWGFGSPI